MDRCLRILAFGWTLVTQPEAALIEKMEGLIRTASNAEPPFGSRSPPFRLTELNSYYQFRDRFGRPGKSNDKGKVERLVKFFRSNIMVPIPEAASFEELMPWKPAGIDSGPDAPGVLSPQTGRLSRRVPHLRGNGCRPA